MNNTAGHGTGAQETRPEQYAFYPNPRRRSESKVARHVRNLDLAFRLVPLCLASIGDVVNHDGAQDRCSLQHRSCLGLFSLLPLLQAINEPLHPDVQNFLFRCEDNPKPAKFLSMALHAIRDGHAFLDPGLAQRLDLGSVLLGFWR